MGTTPITTEVSTQSRSRPTSREIQNRERPEVWLNSLRSLHTNPGGPTIHAIRGLARRPGELLPRLAASRSCESRAFSWLPVALGLLGFARTADVPRVRMEAEPTGLVGSAPSGTSPG